ncbi:uncharacterized protein LOC124380741 isoform X2 [Silurus meridionalis]|nr:uncharacterized protein LOC124380741 isoform X2 [Silurus meridionalis]
MQSFSIHHCVLIFLTLTFTTASVSAAVCSTSVKLLQPVILSCEHKCSASVKWTLFQNRDVVFARCDQTSCTSQQKGYTMSHDQYLKGNLSLSIAAANYSERNTYTCECGVSDITTVRLSIETVFSAVQMSPAEDLLLDLSVPEPVKVFYRSSDSADDELICNVTQSSAQCSSKYTSRTSLHHPQLTLRGVTSSDSGTYTIQNTKYNEDIHVYNVSVTDNQIPWWGIVLMVLLVLVLVLAVIGWIKYRKDANYRLFIKVSKQLVDVNALVNKAQSEGNEAVVKAEKAIKKLKEQYRENPTYSEQIQMFCQGKELQLQRCTGEQGEALILTKRGVRSMMEKVMKSLEMLSEDGEGHLQGNSVTELEQMEQDLIQILEWCRSSTNPQSSTEVENLKKHLEEKCIQ